MRDAQNQTQDVNGLSLDTDKDLAQGDAQMAERPGWLSDLPGVDVMTSEEAKAYVEQWNGQDLANIDVNSPGWTSFAAFISDPANQAAVALMWSNNQDTKLTSKTEVFSEPETKIYP